MTKYNTFVLQVPCYVHTGRRVKFLFFSDGFIS